MKYNQFGQVFTTEDELYNLLYKNPDLDLTKFLVDDPFQFNKSVTELHYDHPKLGVFDEPAMSVEEFDRQNQQTWFMPEQYQTLDIEEYLVSICPEQNYDRLIEELTEYRYRDMLDLLRYLKYLVDTLRANNIVWGLGRGSSVSSYVLFLLGVHKIDSVRYNLDVKEFLK